MEKSPKKMTLGVSWGLGAKKGNILVHDLKFHEIETETEECMKLFIHSPQWEDSEAEPSLQRCLRPSQE